MSKQDLKAELSFLCQGKDHGRGMTLAGIADTGVTWPASDVISSMHHNQPIEMRTTLDIDNDVLQAAKEIARRRKSTAGRVISELVRQALTGPSRKPGAVSEPETFYGFRPLPADDRVVSDETIERLRESEGI